MAPFDGMGWIEISVSREDIMKDGERIAENIMKNAVYEVMEDFITGTYTVRVGNPVLSYKRTGVKALKGTEE